MSSSVIPRSRSSAAIRIASSSDVVVREVAKRKWSASSSPRNIPKWVWVLPTSMVRSTSGLSERPVAGHALALDLGQGAGERVASRRIQLEQRFEHEAALFGLVDVRPRHDTDARALERVTTGAQVHEPVADIRAEAQPGPQRATSYSVRSFQTSTVTSSTGSGIGGSGFVARTVTASAS